MSSASLQDRIVRAAPWALLVGVLLLPVGLRLRSNAGAAGALSDFGIVPDFALVERSGRAVTRAELAGAPWFADFVFTRCTGSCPTLSGEMARLGERVGERARLVSISVDPERDTPAVLSEYADGLAAPPDRWLFLTGEPAAVRRLVAEGFHLAAARDPSTGDDPGITHSDRIALVDADLRIRRYYSGGDGAWIDAAVRDLETLRRR